MGMTIAQSLIQEGRQEGRMEGIREHAHAVLVRLGTRHLGAPDDATRKAIEQITDPDRLDRITDRIEEAPSWADLIAMA